jgi:signal peptidase I
VCSVDKHEGSDSTKEAALQTWIGTGGRATITVTGLSMMPFLGDGSRVVVEPVRQEIRLGDIVVYYHDKVLISHRVVRIKQDQGQLFFQTKGDSALRFDPFLVRRCDLIARVVGLTRGGRILDMDSGLWRLLNPLLAWCSYMVGSILGPLRRRFKSSRKS